MRGLALLIGVFVTGVGHADLIYQKPNVSEMAAQAQVVLIGESHIHAAAKHFVRYVLPQLKNQGFQYLALEMFNLSSQPILDRLDPHAPDFTDKLKRAFEHDWSWNSDEYLITLHEAVKLGFKIVALDGRDVFALKNDGSIAAVLAHNRLRDEFMAKALNEVIRADAQARVIVWAGGMHAAHYALPAILSDVHQITSETFMVATPSVGFHRKTALKECGLPRPTVDCFRAQYESSSANGRHVWTRADRAYAGYDRFVFWENELSAAQSDARPNSNPSLVARGAAPTTSGHGLHETQ